MTPQEFSAAIKKKYPAYANVDDNELVSAMVQKYPVYKSQIQGFESQDISAPTAEPQGKTGLAGIGTGIAKGILSTAKGLGTLGQTVLDQTAGRLVNAAQGKGFTPTTGEQGNIGDLYRKGTQFEQDVAKKLEATTTSEKIGKGAEQIAEFFIPAGAASKAEKFVDVLSKGVTSKALSATARIVGKGAVQGAAGAAITAAQTGGDIKDTATSALTSGALRSGMAVIGEGARALKIPERLYSTIFKNSKSDMLKELNTDGLLALQNSNPAKYDEFIKNGTIKLQNGSPILNETLAEKALDKGLRGSLRTMANEVVEKTLDSENTLRRAVSTFNGTIDMSEKQYLNVFKNIAEDYADVGFGEVSAQASKIVDKLKSTNGLVDAGTALEARRFLDGMRMLTSFDKPASKLSMTQSNFKTLADTLRGRIADNVPGVKETMKNYSFYIDAMDALAAEAKRTGNNQVVGLIDSVFLGGAAASANPSIPVAIGIIRKLTATPAGKTLLAQLINEANMGVVGSAGIGAAGSATASALQSSGQSPQSQ